MTTDDVLARAFDEERERLTAMAHRILGTRGDAEDAVQDTWLRLARQDADAIASLPRWLTTVVARVCLDKLRSRRARPEAPYDGFPDFVVTEDDDEAPDERVALADSVGLALLVVLETLRPDERLVFVLHDVFELPFAEIGRIVGKSTDSAKMLASRARRKVRGAPRSSQDRQRRREVVDAFLAAARDGDFDRLLLVLDPDLTWHAHQRNGEVVKLGVADVVDAVERGRRGAIVACRVLVDGEPGILSWARGGRPVSVMACTVVDGRIVKVVSLLDPTRLAAMDLPPPPPDPPEWQAPA